MTRRPTLFLVGCGVCAGLVLIDFGLTGNRRPSLQAPSPAAEIPKPADPVRSPIRRRPDAPAAANDAASALRDVRLTGVVIGPDLRVAIFAVAGTDPLALSPGDALKDWRVASISAEKVVLSGPGGSMALEPKPDAALVRPPPPAAAPPGQFAPGQFAPGPPPAVVLPSVAPQPIAVTPITIVNLPPPTPVQTQGYPYYSPEYYDAGYGGYFPSFNDYVYPFPYFAYAIPRRIGFGFGFFHHHGIRHGGFHNMAFRGGGFGRRR